MAITMSSITKIPEPHIASQMNILGYFRFAGLGRYKLIYHTTLYNNRGSTLTAIVVLKLHETSDTGISGFKPSLWLKDTHITERSSSIRLLCHGNTRHIDEVKTDGGYSLSVIVTKYKAVIGLIVFVKVGRHNGELTGCGRISCQVYITHQYYRIVIDIRTTG